MYNSEQNGAKMFDLGQNRNFFMNFQSGGKSRFKNPLPSRRNCRKGMGRG